MSPVILVWPAFRVSLAGLNDGEEESGGSPPTRPGQSSSSKGLHHTLNTVRDSTGLYFASLTGSSVTPNPGRVGISKNPSLSMMKGSTVRSSM